MAQRDGFIAIDRTRGEGHACPRSQMRLSRDDGDVAFGRLLLPLLALFHS